MSDPDRPIDFSDLQVVFGLDLHTMQKAVRLLRFAQLLDRRQPARSKPQYFLPKQTASLLTPTVSKLSKSKALDCVGLALDVAATHNAAHHLSQVLAVVVMGTVLDSSVNVHHSVEADPGDGVADPNTRSGHRTAASEPSPNRRRTAHQLGFGTPRWSLD